MPSGTKARTYGQRLIGTSETLGLPDTLGDGSLSAACGSRSLPVSHFPIQ
jgi:hypothetical protein